VCIYGSLVNTKAPIEASLGAGGRKPNAIHRKEVKWVLSESRSTVATVEIVGGMR
jgi:hypothetical protein